MAGTTSPDGAGNLPLLWDISTRDAGTYRLEVEAVDEVGPAGRRPPVEITLRWPAPRRPRRPRPHLRPRAAVRLNVSPSWPAVPEALLPVLAAVAWWLAAAACSPHRTNAHPAHHRC